MAKEILDYIQKTTCSEQENYYWYEQLEQGKNYKLHFCLGEGTDSLEGGLIEATTMGISTIKKRSNLQTDQSSPLNSPFNRSLTLKLNLSDFNEISKIEEPVGTQNNSGSQNNETNN